MEALKTLTYESTLTYHPDNMWTMPWRHEDLETLKTPMARRSYRAPDSLQLKITLHSFHKLETDFKSIMPTPNRLWRCYPPSCWDARS